METSKHYTSEPFFSFGESVIKYVPAHPLHADKISTAVTLLLDITAHHCLVSLYKNRLHVFVSSVATCAWKVRPEHHVSWEREALDSEERKKSATISLVPIQVISKASRKGEKKALKNLVP